MPAKAAAKTPAPSPPDADDIAEIVDRINFIRDVVNNLEWTSLGDQDREDVGAWLKSVLPDIVGNLRVRVLGLVRAILDDYTIT
jgi:hypothetical protein